MTANGPILELKGVTKTFGGVVRALDDVSVAICKNEIVGVVGENGAGKSTLMKILVGVYPPDKGKLFYRGQPVPFPKNPKEAAKMGISIVYQEKGVVPSLKVYQFLFLGHEEKFSRFSKLQVGKMKKIAADLLKEFRIKCHIEDFMYELPLSTQKMVEIARAILMLRLEYGDDVESVIILDEPTAPLNLEERQDLFRDLINMKQKVSFVFVSHIMHEVMEFTDRIHVLRDGKIVASYDLSKEKITEDDLFRVIVGKESNSYSQEMSVKRTISDEVVLEVRNLTKKGSYYDISFNLYEGECLGIFGPEGSGKSEIIHTIAGLLNFDQGDLFIKGQKAKAKEPPHVRLKRGVGYFSGETARELFFNWSITKNISILNINKIIRKITRAISFKAEKKMAENIIQKLNIKTPSASTECYALSGGSKQKVSVGKWFERGPDILLLEDPTIGIDVGARKDIYEATLEMRQRGISMILVSDDPKEYSMLCDKIIYLKNGVIQEVLDPDKFNEVISA